MQTTIGESRITRGAKLEPEHEAQVLEQFYREGYTLLPGVLTADEVACLRELADYYIDHPDAGEGRGYAAPVCTAMVLRCTQSLHRAFCDMLVREPFLGLAEAICGPNAGFCGQNVIRSDKDTAVSYWHIDDILEFPLPDDMLRHDARIRMPVFWFSFQIALSDIESVEHGPTELVPGSHYSGRSVPQNTDTPTFEGRGPVPILCRAGDVYLFNHQLWHRGMINCSDRRRYLMQNQYCKAWGIYRFSAQDNICNLPGDELDGASERLLKLLRRDLQRSIV
jgi:ectoine hydroxylase-related dioxygenase (phytanoyl-CoA dioxygenase family)